MEFFSINVIGFRKTFFRFSILSATALLAAFLILNNGYFIFGNSDPFRNITWPILIGMLLASVFYSYFRKVRLEKIWAFIEFEDQLKAYSKLYQATMFWYLISVLSSCLLAIITARNIFLLFGLIDFLVSLRYYPGQRLFRKELRNDEVILHE